MKNSLDKYQNEVVRSNDNLVVLAPAGSGKTTIIAEKVKRILKENKKNKILIISFTNKTVENIKEKVDKNVEVFTFHKLALKILEEEKENFILNNNLLPYIIDEYFYSLISKSEKKLLKKMFFSFKYESFIASNMFSKYKKDIYSLINLINSYNITENSTLFNSVKTKYEKLFLYLSFKILNIYNEEKKSQNILDLNDVITSATKIAENSFFNYDYIFVDEFQDSSHVRFKLILEIFKHSKAKINIFGDDYQSIYAFSGSDLNILLNIKKYIPGIKTIFLETNYRLNHDLLQVASLFITKNPSQIKKNITTIKECKNTIEIIYYTKEDKEIKKILKNIKNSNKSILFLSRYKHNLEKLNYPYPKLTVHEAKGLESDIVILTSASSGYYGFPSNVYTQNIIKKISNKENFVYSEERRLFYVAITRAVEKLYILTPRENPSPFIKEIKRYIRYLKKTKWRP